MIYRKAASIFPSFLNSITNSYTQVFFSDNRIFAVILLIVSFFDFRAGISGLIAVIISNVAAFLIGFNRVNIKLGLYGFNSLLVGLGLGVYFKPGLEFFFVLIFASLLSLLITVSLEGIIGKYGLPFLSIPFLLGIWLVMLATRHFTSLQLSDRGIYRLNEMFALGGQSMVDMLNLFNNLPWHESIKVYFRSLGAILFQYSLFAGILIGVGLLIYSRIAFILSLLGFFTAYLFYKFIGADIRELGYGYIGYNFILTSIAIGGFFIIPSRWSFLWVILLTPLISIILVGTTIIFMSLQLSVFSLPFNIIVLVFLYILKFRERFITKPELTLYQNYSPEKNLYNHHNFKMRFGRSLFYYFSLPFWGEWKVTQGYNGQYTHRGDWRHALDFELADEDGSVFSGEGSRKEDYHCYNKPVLAPADGRVEEVVTNIEENEPGNFNIENNWGNTIILRHNDHLFSKLSHLKNESILVTQGDYVKKGQSIAACGNSGRSPVPHLHFQIQTTPHIGSKTTEYPIGHFILKRDRKQELKSFSIPGNNDLVSNILKNSALENAFHFIPGQKFIYVATSSDGKSVSEQWEVQIDAVNNTYLECEQTGSRAYFKNDGDIHYFTHFEGKKNSLLFYYFLGCYTVLLGYYKKLVVTDYYPSDIFNNQLVLLLHDFIAPFRIFVRSVFSIGYAGMDDELMQTNIHLKSRATSRIGKFVTKEIEFEMFITGRGLESFTITRQGRRTEVKLNLS